MRYVVEGRDVRDIKKNRVAMLISPLQARDAAEWLNSGHPAADPEGYTWHEDSLPERDST